MRKLILTILTILIILLPLSAQAYEVHLGWNAAMAPPHNEPVVGNKVARYRLQVKPSVEFKYFRYSLQVDAWGVNKWQPSSVVGHWPDSISGSDWSVEEWRVATTHRAEVGPYKVHAYIEYYMPLDRHNWGGHGMERHYYTLIGIGGRF